MANPETRRDKIRELLTRGVEAIYPSRESLEKLLLAGKKIRIYNGIDPTGKLHIGNAVALRKLREFQDLGHEVIVLIGDFTARIGDPTDKTATRRKLTTDEVKKNARNYKKLIGKILDLKRSNIRFLNNEKWTNKLTPADMLELASYFTVSRLLERDMFQNRIKEGRDIRVHEFLYPIFQAYDSVTMNVDMEIGGTDQTFNMLAGRTLMRKLKNKEKFVLTMPLLTDPNGKKMGKTEGAKINLDDVPEEMYGKIMAIPDSSVLPFFTQCTDVSTNELSAMRQGLKTATVHPRDLKMKLARHFVTTFHSAKAAAKAETRFVHVFQKKETPEDIETVTLTTWPVTLGRALVAAGLATSASEARRLVIQGGIRVNGVTATNTAAPLPAGEVLLARGKRMYRRLRRASA